MPDYFICSNELYGYDQQRQVFWFYQWFSPQLIAAAHGQSAHSILTFIVSEIVHRIDDSGKLWRCDRDGRWSLTPLYSSSYEALILAPMDPFPPNDQLIVGGATLGAGPVPEEQSTASSISLRIIIPNTLQVSAHDLNTLETFTESQNGSPVSSQLISHLHI
ncbi:hypothetical protein FRC12_003241 [Ceratobasidium sp. 428]|nr:hypothetical protein FRC12_003241 [Ceratobasidium sp. 428]